MPFGQEDEPPRRRERQDELDFVIHFSPWRPLRLGGFSLSALSERHWRQSSVMLRRLRAENVGRVARALEALRA